VTPDAPLNSNERRKLLHHAEADLTWLLTGGNRYRRAVAILMDSELQAAIIRSQNPGGGRKTEGSTAWSDPTGQTALSAAACEVRAGAVRKVWIRQAEEVAGAVAVAERFVLTVPGEQRLPMPTGPRSTITMIQWLTIAPQNRVFRLADRADLSASDLDEVDHAIRWAAKSAGDLRQGRNLTTSGGQRVPSVFAVLEAARLVMKVPVEPAPVQKPMEGCVSCKRNNGHHTPIDLKNHSARSMCRVCGDYYSGEHAMLPIEAVKYMHRTGKNLTWKIIEDAKRAERAS
jgi:hypothetical protein